ncbi:tRNA and rRNA cytosine-C5-methylase [Nonlabens ulvanivorans]|nr:tRNA and rRNA cytosine-C5-methylase [Nonlabens ulvanivorans]
MGGIWEKEASALNKQADVVLRANSLKTTPAELKEKLQSEEIAVSQQERFPDALILKERANVFYDASIQRWTF